jgi:hypothetical protein
MAYNPIQSNILSGLEKYASIEAGLIASTDATTTGKRMPADIKSGYKHLLNVEQMGRKRLLLIDPATGNYIAGPPRGQTFKAKDIVRVLLTQPELMKDISDLSNMMRGAPGKPSGFVINTGREYRFEGAEHRSKYRNVGRPIVLPKGLNHIIKRMLAGIGKTVKGEFVFHPKILAEIEAVDKAMRAGGVTGALPTAGTGKQWTTEVLTRYSGDLKASTSEGLINTLLKLKDNLVRIVEKGTVVLPEEWAEGIKPAPHPKTGKMMQPMEILKARHLAQKPIEMGKLAELLKKQQTGTLALIDKVAKTQPKLATTIRELFLEKPIYDGSGTSVTRSALVEAIGEIEGETLSKGGRTTKGLLLRHVTENFPEREARPKWVRPERKEILAGIGRESNLIRKAPGESWKRGDLKKRMWIDIPGHKRQKTVGSYKGKVHFLVDSQKKMGVKPTKAEASLATARLESGGHAAGWGATKYPLTELGPELGDTGKRLPGKAPVAKTSGVKAPPIAELERISQAGGNLGVQRVDIREVGGQVDDVKLAEKAKAERLRKNIKQLPSRQQIGKAKFNIPSSPWFRSIKRAPKSLLPLMILAGLVGTMGSNQGMRNAA